MRGIALSKLTGYMIDREALRSEACMKARMKQIDIYIGWEKLSAATDVLHKHVVGGISLTEMKGRGKIPHDPVPYTIQAYTYDKKMGHWLYKK